MPIYGVLCSDADGVEVRDLTFGASWLFSAEDLNHCFDGLEFAAEARIGPVRNHGFYTDSAHLSSCIHLLRLTLHD